MMLGTELEISNTTTLSGCADCSTDNQVAELGCRMRYIYAGIVALHEGYMTWYDTYRVSVVQRTGHACACSRHKCVSDSKSEMKSMKSSGAVTVRQNIMHQNAERNSNEIPLC